MADQPPIDAMADIVRGNSLRERIDTETRSRGMSAPPVHMQRALGSPANGHIGFASVRQALDEVQQRLQSVVLASEEVMRFHARPQPMKEDRPMQDLPGDRPDGTVWEDLATRAVLLSRSIESLERNLKITLETLR